MTSDEAPDRLRQLLRDAGVDLDPPTSGDVERTWEVIRQFAEEPVDDAQAPEDGGDGILAQYGIFAWEGPPHFELDMTRQFSFADDDGEYSHMTQLQCTFSSPSQTSYAPSARTPLVVRPPTRRLLPEGSRHAGVSRRA